MNRVLTAVCCLFLISCGNKGPIKIGSVAGLSGRYSELGVAGRNGVDLAIMQTNDAGGIQGRMLQLVSADTGNSPEKCGQEISRLISHGAQFLIGPYTSNMAEATIKAISGKNVLVISPTISTDSVTGKKDNFMRVMTTNQDKAKRTAEYFHKKHHTSIAVTYDIKNAAFAETLYNQFTSAMKKLNPDCSIYGIPVNVDAESFSTSAEKVLATNATALFNITAGIDGAALCQQLAKRNSSLTIVGAVWMRTNDLIAHGGRSVEGVHFVGKYDSKIKTQKFQDFKKEYELRFGIEPSFSSFYAYEAASVLIEALKEVKNIDATAVQTKILQTGTYSGLQEPIIFNEFGDVQRKATVTKVENGAFVIDE